MSKYTQGPWKLRQLSLTGFGKPGYSTRYDLDVPNEIGSQSAGVIEVFGDEGQANARLIAAAPEMLEALERMATIIEETNAIGTITQLMGAYLDVCHAIKTAGGK